MKKKRLACLKQNLLVLKECNIKHTMHQDKVLKYKSNQHQDSQREKQSSESHGKLPKHLCSGAIINNTPVFCEKIYTPPRTISWVFLKNFRCTFISFTDYFFYYLYLHSRVLLMLQKQVSTIQNQPYKRDLKSHNRLCTVMLFLPCI